MRQPVVPSGKTFGNRVKLVRLKLQLFGRSVRNAAENGDMKTTSKTRPGNVKGRLVAISQHVPVSTVDVRSDLSHRQRAGGSVTTENVNIVADQADGAGSGAMRFLPLPLNSARIKSRHSLCERFFIDVSIRCDRQIPS
jgi:hypothetical protein